MPDGTATAHLYKPKLVTILSEGYSRDHLRKDLLAGLTVAIVALPLSMAFAIASGVSPERGLYTAIIGGFLVSALGGSRYQIGGPAGAFIVLLSTTVQRFGLDGMLLAVFLSGLMLTVVGISRLGSLIRHIPHAVTVGFTAGIAVVILASQLTALGGLELHRAEPGPFLPKIAAIVSVIGTLRPAALAISLGCASLIFLQRWLKPTWPGMLLAVIAASFVAHLMHLPIETIGSKFGEIPHGLPYPRMVHVSITQIIAILPNALAFTLLGGVESLLSAKVADSMTGRKHRSNMELVAQGIANIASALFGGIAVTGTIARTATNVRAGARSPLAGMFHAMFVLVFLLVAAPLARYVPLASLAGVLLVVCWYMVEKREVVRLLGYWPTALVLISTFVLTVLKDLSTGIIVGCIVAILLAFIHRQVPEEGN